MPRHARKCRHANMISVNTYNPTNVKVPFSFVYVYVCPFAGSFVILYLLFGVGMACLIWIHVYICGQFIYVTTSDMPCFWQFLC